MNSQEAKKKIKKIYNKIEYELIINIASKFKDNFVDEELTEKQLENWEQEKLQEKNKLLKENVKIINSNTQGKTYTLFSLLTTFITKKATESISKFSSFVKKAVTGGFLKKSEKPLISQEIQNIINKKRKLSLEDYNKINSTLLQNSKLEYDNIIKSVNLELKDNINKPKEILKDNIKKMVNKGIPAKVDKDKKYNQNPYIEIVNNSIAKNIEITVQQEKFKEWDIDIIEVSSHADARPLCAPDEGQLYSMSGGSGYVKDASGNSIEYRDFGSTSYGEIAGLFGLNCKHFETPFIPDFSSMQEEGQERKYADERKEALLKQRLYEREIRTNKIEIEALKSANLEFEKENIKLKQKENKIKEFVKANDLKRNYENEDVY